MNARFAEALGLTGPQTRNRSLDSFLVDPAPLQHIAAALDSQCSMPSLEFTMRRTDGSVWAAVIAARKISADHVVLTFIDISERRRIEEELRQSHAESNLYLDILTHDINNMNAAGLTYSRMLAGPSPGTREETSAKILRPLERIEEIIRNISVLRKLRAEPVTLTPVLLAPLLHKEILLFPAVAIDYDGSDAEVLADDMLASVFTNLIGNAAKFGGSGSRVIIRVEDRGTEAGVTVADTGKGIPDSLKPVVFDRFQRGDTTVSGKGLGLFICKSLIERYGGTIQVGDRIPGDPSQGAAFRLTLKKA
jgi:signal transduction histidine kinase